jgi:hypothetical protein
MNSQKIKFNSNTTHNIPASTFFGRDGRCVQGLVNLHRNIVIYDY